MRLRVGRCFFCVMCAVLTLFYILRLKPNWLLLPISFRWFNKINVQRIENYFLQRPRFSHYGIHFQRLLGLWQWVCPLSHYHFVFNSPEVVHTKYCNKILRFRSFKRIVLRQHDYEKSYQITNKKFKLNTRFFSFLFLLT